MEPTATKRRDAGDGSPASPVTRRDFVKRAGLVLATATAGMQLYTPLIAQDTVGNADELAIAIIGVGGQGKNLLTKCLKIPGIRFVAACDIWPMRREYVTRLLKKYDQAINTYEDYNEMLAKEMHLDAVIVASPDMFHAEHAIACLKAGKHVYCEKEMSRDLSKAKDMVLAARDSGKLLQIGHQRRSNIMYQHAIKLMRKDKVLGRITNVSAQWHRPQILTRGWHPRTVIDDDTLKRYGYGSMQEFANWRWFRKYSGGPIADLGSHQIDIFGWFLEANPSSVIASASQDYYKDKGDWYDNVYAIYEFETKAGRVRGNYEILNTSSHGGFYETFLGDQGSLVVSEDPRKCHFFREQTAKRREWEDESEVVEKMGKDAIELKIGETLSADGKKDPEGQRLLAESKKDKHQLHLENFFNAVRVKTPLSCPPEVAFETAVAVLKVNDAIASQSRVTYTASEFKV